MKTKGRANKAVGIILCIAIGASLFFLGDSIALRRLQITSASPQQLANAMQGDSFYSRYRERTIIVHGIAVTADSHNVNHHIIGLQTTTSYQVLCDLGTNATPIHMGDTITVVAEGAAAERQPNAVLFIGCQTLQ